MNTINQRLKCSWIQNTQATVQDNSVLLTKLALKLILYHYDFNHDIIVVHYMSYLFPHWKSCTSLILGINRSHINLTQAGSDPGIWLRGVGRGGSHGIVPCKRGAGVRARTTCKFSETMHPFQRNVRKVVIFYYFFPSMWRGRGGHHNTPPLDRIQNYLCYYWLLFNNLMCSTYSIWLDWPIESSDNKSSSQLDYGCLCTLRYLLQVIISNFSTVFALLFNFF